MIYTHGLGDAQTATTITQVGSTVAGVGASIALPLLGATAAIPFVGAGIAAVTLLISMFNRHGAQKEAASKIVDAVEPYMKQNLEAWNASEKTVQEQQQALANFDSLWQQVIAKESDPNLGDAGRRGISERSPGGKWDWFAYYRNPIANDPNVKSGVLNAYGMPSSRGSNWLVVLAGVGVIGYLLAKG